MSELVKVSREGNVGVLAVNNPPVNALSPGVPEGILRGLAELQQQGAQAIVLIGSGRTFIAGADINEFAKATTGQKKLDPALSQIFSALEACRVPVVAAIHGTALGGGLEIALACHARVAVAAAQVGQPEVKLGIIPGGGGTQRLPRLCGLIKAAEMCAGGEPISAVEAQRIGIVDRLIEGDLPSGAVAYARELIGRPPRRTRDLPVEPADPQALATVRSAIEKKARGRTAPLRALEAVEAAVLPFDEGIKKEAAIFAECLHSEQSKALVHVFFAERAVVKIPGLPRDTPVTTIRRAAVVGAGTMGGGITMNYANAGIPVLLAEVSQDALDRGMATIRKNYATTVQKGRLSEQQMNERLALIEPVVGYDRFGEVDIVAEAVFEGMALKKQVFEQLSRVVRPDAILASNTSTLDIDEIASVTDRPQQVIGHHFFSPANVMRLLEIVRGKQTSPAVIATSIALAKKLNKVGVLVGNCRGFVGNRMFFPYQRESQFLLEEGARVDEVDAALTAFGMALGPLAVADLAGLDVGWRIRQEYKHLVPQGVRIPLVEDSLCERGRYGQKTGSGWYLYQAGSRAAVADPEVEQLIAATATKAGINRRAITPSEIVERTIYALVNEGAQILAEGIALRALDIDVIYINGYGFPAHRGGPMWYADSVGLDRVYARIKEFERQHGAAWTPAPLLAELAESGKTFADYDRSRSEGL